MAVPNTFATSTSAIPLGNLDANFAYYDAGFSLSGTAVTFAGSITLTTGTANGVPYLNATKVLTTGSAFTFSGTNAVINVTDNTNAALRITQLGSGNALLVEDSTNIDASPFLINNGGVVVKGATQSYETTTGNTPVVQLHGATTSTQNVGYAATNWATAAGGSSFTLAKSRGGVIGTHGITLNNDTIGIMYFMGSDGTTFIPAAQIQASVDGIPGQNAGTFTIGLSYRILTIGTTDFTLIGAASNTVGLTFTATGVGAGTGTAILTTGDMPGRLVFSTTADGAATPTERMRISSAGLTTVTGTLKVTTGAAVGNATPAAGGVAFPATAVAVSDANTLDDYEEGTWTPNQGAGLTVVGTFSATGTYTKIGRQVTVVFTVAGATTIAVTAGGQITGNLPFSTLTGIDNAGTIYRFGASGGQCIAGNNQTNVFSGAALVAGGGLSISISYFV